MMSVCRAVSAVLQEGAGDDAQTCRTRSNHLNPTYSTELDQILDAAAPALRIVGHLKPIRRVAKAVRGRYVLLFAGGGGEDDLESLSNLLGEQLPPPRHLRRRARHHAFQWARL